MSNQNIYNLLVKETGLNTNYTYGAQGKSTDLCIDGMLIVNGNTDIWLVRCKLGWVNVYKLKPEIKNFGEAFKTKNS